MYNFNVPLHIKNQRMQTCSKCKFFNSTFQTCGTPVIGGKAMPENDVTYYKEPIQLCGCFMPLKTKFKFTSCPAHKWHAHEWSNSDIIELSEFITSIQAANKLTSSDVTKLNAYVNRMTGKNQPIGNCPECIRQLLSEFKRQLGKLTDDQLIITDSIEFNNALKQLLNDKKNNRISTDTTEETHTTDV